METIQTTTIAVVYPFTEDDITTRLQKYTGLTADTVTIPKSRHEELLRAEDKLSALEEMGVDNWPGYSEAMALLADEARMLGREA